MRNAECTLSLKRQATQQPENHCFFKKKMTDFSST